MSLPARFVLRRPMIISDIIDGEVVIVNMDTGAYYSLDGSGAVAWQALERGLSVTQIVADLEHSFVSTPDDIHEVVEQFVRQLWTETLIVPDDHPEAAAPPNSPAQPADRIPFQPPVLHRYDDMQDLILLDPIHEVDETGWPARPGETGAA
jgi:hypothetical protein